MRSLDRAGGSEVRTECESTFPRRVQEEICVEVCRKNLDEKRYQRYRDSQHPAPHDLQDEGVYGMILFENIVRKAGAP